MIRSYISSISAVCVIIFHVFMKDATGNNCKYTSVNNFTDCASRAGLKKRLLARNLNLVSKLDPKAKGVPGCAYSNVCRKLFRVGRIYRQGFGATLSIEVAKMLRGCCGNCTKYHQTKLLPPLQKENQTVVNKLDIIYPFYAAQSVDRIYGHYFIPVLNIPSAFYFSLAKTDKEIGEDIILGCLGMWPLLLMCLSLSLVAGFFVWILDTWSNREEFPRSFLAGIREGFWWSFVSMTTVGYGDKAPKSSPARVFGVFWIIIGITVLSIYIAALASAILAEAGEKGPQEFHGLKVGTLQNRIYDSYMISQHGGILYEHPFKSTAQGMVDLLTLLRDKEIDGLLVSRTTYYYYSRLKDEDKKFAEGVRDIKLDKTETLFREGSHLIAGMLVKDKDVYEFYKGYFQNNWPQIQGCYAYGLNYKDKKFVKEPSNPLKALFVPFFVGTVVFLILIFIFGGVYEYLRRRRRAKNRGGNETDEHAETTLWT